MRDVPIGTVSVTFCDNLMALADGGPGHGVRPGRRGIQRGTTLHLPGPWTGSHRHW
ncbi:hypothetical protein CHLRE_14g620217v5 [Chlamydomonas reinhardtii]|uniref:Uncharacterized protein n=1 Tax=Chlamydomonas reinhardtii TaxID=3055 RepID=A0A2K3CY02_CHLRE|nr:uncharacterized protein CHLRE_14g620217v5 [Chlamydomonas reinhardtii]PNW73139.1 hypothetical protein CHLRE_14g620217v5 [Chlamydomonas reinhardtii]